MNSQVVDRLIMELELELGKFKTQSNEAEAINQRLQKALTQTEGSGDKAGESLQGMGDKTQKANKKTESMISSVMTVGKRLAGLFAVITSSNALTKLASQVSQANDELKFMSDRLAMNARGIKEMGNAAAMLGGNADSMRGTMKALNQSIQEMVIMGDASMIPFFAALGVGVTDASGKVREMDDILLDMADSFAGMDKRQAYAIASAMGLDEGTANALLQGRSAMQDMIAMQKTLYVSTEQELRASRELNKAQAYMSAQWESMKTMIGNMLIPVLHRMTKSVSGFFDYLQRNERTVKNVFEGLAYVIGILLVPVIYKAIAGMVALLAPVAAATGAVGLLAAGFLALYDDYKTWSEGGKSLFNWGEFNQYIKDVNVSARTLGEGFVFLLTGYKSWADAKGGMTDWLKMKGFIDANGISVNNLGTAFKNLAKDLIDSVPLLKTFAEIIDMLMNGDLSGAALKVLTIPAELAKAGYSATVAVGERLGGAIDTGLGIDSERSGSAAGLVRSVGGWGKSTLNKVLGAMPEYARPSGSGDSDIDAMLAREEERAGLPKGMLRSLMMQETSGDQSYIDDPGKYHYPLNSDGRRVAPHTGKISTAHGPFGILDSTARDPGYGVTPMGDRNSLSEHARFTADYLAARIKSAGSVEGGLAGYGEGSKYSQSVMGRLNSGAERAKKFSRGDASIASTSPSGNNTSQSISVQVNGLQVNTSASTLPAASSEAVGAAISRGLGGALDQLGSGL